VDQITKICTVCGIEKPLEEFNKQKLGKYGRRAYCRECQKKAAAEYRCSEQGRQKRNAWKKTEKGRACQARYRASEACRASRRAREQTEEYKQRRKRARDESRFGGNREKALQRDGYRCVDCGSKKNLQVHHIDELGRNKPKEIQNHSLDNLVTLCGDCHLKRHNPVLARWGKRGGGYYSSHSNASRASVSETDTIF